MLNCSVLICNWKESKDLSVFLPKVLGHWLSMTLPRQKASYLQIYPSTFIANWENNPIEALLCCLLHNLIQLTFSHKSKHPPNKFAITPQSIPLIILQDVTPTTLLHIFGFGLPRTKSFLHNHQQQSLA